MKRSMLLASSMLVVLCSTPSLGMQTLIKCTENDDLYSPPYQVLVDSRSMQLRMTKSNAISSDEELTYQIQDINKAGDAIVIKASRRTIGSAIVLSLSPKPQLTYMDLFTDRPISTDYCSIIPARSRGAK